MYDMATSKLKGKIKIPFGSKTERFSALHLHPRLETRLGTYKFPNIFPGCHDWNKTPKIKSKISRWKKCLETEEYSKRLGYRGDDILKLKKWEKSINGPGWHEVPLLPSGRQIVFLKNVRFPKPKLFTVPGPGTYGKNHVPFTRIEEKSRSKGFSFSVLMPLDKAAGRSKSLDPQPSYHLPPNTYNLKTSIEELIDKRISKRGPYDLFTGPRFQKQVIPERFDKKSLVPLRIDPNDYDHPKNKFKGKFMKCGKGGLITNRMILKDSTASTHANPGPDRYNPYKQITVQPTTFPFNCSLAEVRPKLKREIFPPPGRYNPDSKKRIKGNGLRSVFKSTTKRVMPTAPKWSWFE